MDRKKIKSEAWEFIKGKKWQIWWPLLVISLITSVLEGLSGPRNQVDFSNMTVVTAAPTPTQAALSLVFGFIGAAL